MNSSLAKAEKDQRRTEEIFDFQSLVWGSNHGSKHVKIDNIALKQDNAISQQICNLYSVTRASLGVKHTVHQPPYPITKWPLYHPAGSIFLSRVLANTIRVRVPQGAVNMTDFILRKKPGKNEIHTIRIMGNMSTEFNTMMKHYSKLAAQNYKKSNPSNDQWGGQNHRSSLNTAMVKLLVCNSACMNLKKPRS